MGLQALGGLGGDVKIGHWWHSRGCMRISRILAQGSLLTPSHGAVGSAHWLVARHFFYSLSVSSPSLTARRSSDMLLVHGQHLLAEIIQGPDGVQATWMLPGVTGTDLFSFKQKGNLVAGYWGLRGSKQSARTDLKSSPKRPRTIKHNPNL